MTSPGACRRRVRLAPAMLACAAAGYTALQWLGRGYGSTPGERAAALPGDDLVTDPQFVLTHAITIDAPPAAVWPWLIQMGWHQGGWYTARWVDRLLFPANWASTDRIIPELQQRKVGDFIPDGAPETECGFLVEQIDQHHHLVLRSTTHLPLKWREQLGARIDWTWAFALTAVDGGSRTRFVFRTRARLAPWWVTAGFWLGIIPADFVMSRDMLHGVKTRAEGAAPPPASSPADDRAAVPSGPIGDPLPPDGILSTSPTRCPVEHPSGLERWAGCGASAAR